MNIAIVNFQTFGDYLLKSPFIFSLLTASPSAKLTVFTNARGAQTFPIIDQRIRVIAIDRAWSVMANLRNLASAGLELFDRLYAVDQNSTTTIISSALRARRKYGFLDSIDELFDGREMATISSCAPWQRLIHRIIFYRPAIRRPSDKYEGDNELLLLPVGERAGEGRALHECRTLFSNPMPRQRENKIYISTTSSWGPRSLTEDQWVATILALSSLLPDAEVIVQGWRVLPEALTKLRTVRLYQQTKSLMDLVELVARCRAVISVDSFPVHLASFLNTPVVALFGPALPHRFRPTSSATEILYHRPVCAPCVQARDSATCRAGELQCRSLSAMQGSVVAAATAHVIKTAEVTQRT